MDADDARWLVGPDGAAELARAAAEADPRSLAAAERLRRRLPPSRAAVVTAQVALRRRARVKFGARAETLFFTPDGLEQATRPAVAAWRARRLTEAGVTRVIDLGCGIGADALGMLDEGLDVEAIDADEATAVLASANLGRQVTVGDGVRLLGPARADTAVFCDPARRTGSGRSWRVEDLSPPWSFVQQVLADHLACVKLGPGLPHTLIPDAVAATWVSERGDLVELSLWSGPWPAERRAVLLPGGQELRDRAVAGDTGPGGVPEPGTVVYEPDPAVIRAGLVDVLADDLGARRVQPGLAYLTAPSAVATAFATAFEVLEVLDAGERTLRAWVRANGVGTLEIKKRGLDVDPAALRRRLKPRGPNTATLVLTPTTRGARTLVVRRLPGGGGIPGRARDDEVPEGHPGSSPG